MIKFRELERRKWLALALTVAMMFVFLVFHDKVQTEVVIKEKIVVQEKIVVREKVIFTEKTSPHHYYSQSNEDKALFETIYATRAADYGGVVLEMGALDGLKFSISKFFEDELHWRSILIEANPNNFKKLLKNRPRATNINTAICNQESIAFVGEGAVGGVPQFMRGGHQERWISDDDNEVTVPCTSFERVFRDHDVSGIDVLVLDIEGGEYEALKLMDWSIPVGIWVIEGGENSANVTSLLNAHGYERTKWDIRSFCDKGGDCSSNICYTRILNM